MKIPNFLQKGIAALAPTFALNREVSRMKLDALGSYRGADRGGRTLGKWQPYSASADYDTLDDLPVMRARCRDLERNDGFAGGVINTAVTNVVGTGLTIQPRIDSEFLGLNEAETAKWQAHTKREFSLWADSKDCDATRTQNFYQLQNLVFRSVLSSGDVFVLLPMIARNTTPYKTALQIIEADRVCNRQGKADGGITLNSMGEAISYTIRSRHPVEMGVVEDSYRDIPARGAQTGRRNILHIMQRNRPSQRRGVPYLAPVIVMLKQISRFTEAELTAAVIGSMFSVFVKNDGESPLDGDENRNYQLGEGTIISGAAGDSVEMIESKRPSALYDPFVMAILKQVGSTLEIPLEMITKHYTSSYTAARAAFLEAWRFFKGRRYFLAEEFIKPCYEAFMNEAVSSGRIIADGYFDDPLIKSAWLGCQIVGDSQGSVDPLKEVKAIEAALNIGLTSLETATMQYDGSEWAQNHAQQSKEHQARTDAGLIIDAKQAALDANQLATQP
jgi:lambda family phage portal protein